ncbi:MAG: site-specific integrase, partial [Pseudomonadota bacterium]
MAILIRCSCKTDLKLSAKKCHKCGSPIPAKGRTYRVVLRSGGHKVTRTVTNLALAREIEAKLKLEIQRGEYDLKRKRPAPTLNTIWTKYLAWVKENKKSWRTDFYYYRKHLEPAFGLKSLGAVSPFEIEKLMLSLKKGLNKHNRLYTPATIKHQIVLLSPLYSLAGIWGLYSGP